MQTRAFLRSAAALLMSLSFAALATTTSCGAPCADGETQVCNEDGSSCVCAASCATYKDCDAAHPDERRYCYTKEDGFSACLPASLFYQNCSSGAACNGQCDSSGNCFSLCRSGADCPSGCCYLLSENSNPLCDPVGFTNPGNCI